MGSEMCIRDRLGAVGHHVVWQDHPEFILDEFSWFFLDEGLVLGCRVVASSVDALILLISGPCLVVAFSGDTLVSP